MEQKKSESFWLFLFYVYNSELQSKNSQASRAKFWPKPRHHTFDSVSVKATCMICPRFVQPASGSPGCSKALAGCLDPCRWNYPAKLVCNPGAPWLQHAETPLRINSHRPGVLLMVLLKFVKSSAYFVMAFIFWVYVLMCILIDKTCM